MVKYKEFKFKKEYSFESRKKESEKMMRNHPDRVPIIVESKSPDIVLDKKRFLVPSDLTVGQFVFVIRKRTKMRPEQGIFLFTGENIPRATATISSIYEEKKDEDGFLYCTVVLENTFGSFPCKNFEHCH